MQGRELHAAALLMFSRGLWQGTVPRALGSTIPYKLLAAKPRLLRTRLPRTLHTAGALLSYCLFFNLGV